MNMLKKFVLAVMIPGFVLSMELLFHYLFDDSSLVFGISLASIALAQIFPFLFEEELAVIKSFWIAVD